MMRNFKRLIGPALIAGAITITAAAVPTADKSHDAALTRNLNIFNDIVRELEMNYVDSLRPDESMRAAIDALLSTIDPYTEYYDSSDQEQLQRMTTGEYGGIGSYIIERNGRSYIAQPMEGAPAQLAGLKAGDHILRVDTVDVSQKGSADVTKLLRGQAGTSVEVTVARPYVTDSIVTVNIERRKLQEPSVPYYTVKGNTGYIRLTGFIDKSPLEVRTALEEFKKDPRVKNIVLDLRGNGGGLIESAIDIVSNFVPKGTEVVRTRYRDASNEKTYKTTREPLFPDIPLAVLIDGGTASSSEITAGALQDLDRAVLVGNRSFGKGLVQSTRPLPFSGLLKITVAKYYIPSGRLVQALDYSHRNPDGSVARVPDSLTNVFHTAGGREVRDGGGLRPDTTINWGQPTRIVYNIVRDNWAFDYATKFAAEHPSIARGEEFVISDSVYADFKKSIDPTRFKYDKACEEMISTLRTTAEAEGYMNPEVKARIDTLATLLTHNLDKDLDTHRKQIEEYLGAEIVSRYYYEAGKTAYELQTDKAFATAVDILENPELYNSILHPGTATTGKGKGTPEKGAAGKAKSKAKGPAGKK
ncbi:MAG: S41 family peptidase [Bacteroidales bacterium]|nr:S41 family peptidase [Bacteroidales bacterium]